MILNIIISEPDFLHPPAFSSRPIPLPVDFFLDSAENYTRPLLPRRNPWAEKIAVF
jgi:hypothetical protein